MQAESTPTAAHTLQVQGQGSSEHQPEPCTRADPTLAVQTRPGQAQGRVDAGFGLANRHEGAWLSLEGLRVPSVKEDMAHKCSAGHKSPDLPVEL